MTSSSRQGRGVLIWAWAATLAALVFGNLALWLFVERRAANAQLARFKAEASARARHAAPVNHSRPEPVSAETPFASLRESDVVGRYRLFQEGVDVGVVQLLKDHSMINKDGTTYPQYRWEIEPNRLMTRWQAGHIYFDLMPRPGVFVARLKGNDDYRRLEKIEDEEKP